MLTSDKLKASLSFKINNKQTPIDDLPTLPELEEFLRIIELRIPVTHRSPLEPVIDDKSKYPVVRLASGKYSIKPNITKQGLLYRGENACYPRSEPSFARGWTHANGMLANIRIEELYLALRTSHPMFQMLAKGIEVNDRVLIRIENPMGIASVYGMVSQHMHLTSDLDVALFYATTDYDEQTGMYIPHQIKDDDETKVGCIYTFQMTLPMPYLPMLSTAGYMPFPRMEYQKTFLYFLRRGDELNNLPMVRKLYFRHDTSLESQFNQKFDAGAQLCPPDEISAMVARVTNAKFVSDSCFRANLKSNPSDNENQNRSELESLGKEIRNEDFIFSGNDLQPYYNRIEDGFWQKYCDCLDFSTFRHPEEVQDFFADLPNNPKYSQYFTK